MYCGRRFAGNIFLIMCALAGVNGAANASCTDLTRGYIAIQAERCAVIDPRTRFSQRESLPDWVLAMDQASRAKFLANYRGVLVTGLVKKSAAVRTGLLPSQQAFKGELLTIFTRELPGGCSSLAGRQIVGQLEEQCCDGSGSAPCLLDEKYLLTGTKIVNQVAAPTGKVTPSLDYQSGRQFYEARQYYKAITHLQRAYKKGELDIQGKWILGNAFENTEDCQAAVVPLWDIQKAWVQGSTSATDDRVVGASLLLLGRCLARSSKPVQAAEVLSLLLAHPKKFREEIRIGASHRDFSWIKMAPEYKDFQANARRVLEKR